jgi:hypothetical protein
VEGGELELLIWRTVDVVGVVRKIRPKQYVNGKNLDLIEDPDLPVMPPPDSDRPPISLSYLSIFDATPPAHRSSSKKLAALINDPASQKRSSSVVGQFRNANLFGDLPDLRSRNADAFVLKNGDAAI